MTSRHTKLSLRAALLATAAVGALAMAPTAAYADAYAFVGVDVDNLLFSGINAFSGGNSFETTGSSAGTAGIGVENTDSGSVSTVKDNLDLTGGRGMTNNVNSASQLGTNPGASASSIPQVGDTGSYGVTDSIIIGSKSNTNPASAGGAAVAGASWRASAEAALNQTGGSQTATSTQTLTWNLTVGANTTVTMSFDISLSMISELSPAGQSAKGSYALSLQYTNGGGGGITRQLVETVDGTKTANQSTLVLGNGCTSSASSLGSDFIHISCSEALATGSASTGATLSLTSTEFVNVVNTPEPASLSIMGAGLLGLGAVARRRRNKKA